MPTWDADLYLKFGRERTQPAIDLVSRILLDDPATVIDLGCGPGNSAAILRKRWPEARIVGLDNSAEMIAQASETHADIEWELGNIAEWEPDEQFDVVFSNAAYQWMSDHGSLFRKLNGHVAEGGVFAAQLPYHYASPLNQVLLKVSLDSAWNSAMETARDALNHETASFYYDTLQPMYDRIELWETEYFHPMENPQAIVDFIRGTGLRPFLESLKSTEGRHCFEAMVLDGYTKAYPTQNDGSILFPFRRQFIIAYK